MNQGPRARAALLRLPSFILLTSSFLLAGCNIIEGASAVAYKVKGPPAVEARYVPAAGDPMLVLVENYEAPTAAYHDAEQLARAVTERLREHGVAPVVPADPLYDLRTSDPEVYRSKSIAGLGRLAGARQVLYIELVQAVIAAPAGSEYVRGKATARVRIVDVESGLNRWPEDAAEGYPVAYETPLPRSDEGATVATVRQRLHAALGERIARLFHKWKPQDMSPRDD